MNLKPLLRGCEKRGAIAVLITLSDITSESKIEALYDYYCTGHTLTGACTINDVDESNFRKTIVTIEAIAIHLDNYFLIKGFERSDRKHGFSG